MYSILLLGFASFALSLFLTPLVRDVFRRLGVVDHPDNELKLHHRPIPRVGGIAIVLSYTLAFGLLLITKLSAGIIVWVAFPLIWKIFPAAMLIFFTGLLDDLVRLKPWQKLIGQIVAASVAYFGGVQVLAVGGQHFSYWWSFPATIVWLVACTNAVNLIDGMDGLAAGVGLFATTTSLLAAFMTHNVELAMATLPLAACLLGFLRYNFNPATIFLGDPAVCSSVSCSAVMGFMVSEVRDPARYDSPAHCVIDPSTRYRGRDRAALPSPQAYFRWRSGPYSPSFARSRPNAAPRRASPLWNLRARCLVLSLDGE